MLFVYNTNSVHFMIETAVKKTENTTDISSIRLLMHGQLIKICKIIVIFDSNKCMFLIILIR